MKILSSTHENNSITRIDKPVFLGRIKADQKTISDFSAEMLKNFNTQNVSPQLTKTLQTIMDDPAQKNIFLATVASLVTATAVKITELITGNNNTKNKTQAPSKAKKVTNKDGDSLEVTSPKKTKQHKEILKPAKHRGCQAEFETALLGAINTVNRNLKLDIQENNSLIELFNQFCGQNYKGQHYDSQNNIVPNKNIAENLTQELINCDNKELLQQINAKYRTYTSEAKSIVQTPSSDEEAAALDEDIIKILKPYKNLSDNYIKLASNEETKKQLPMVENFLKSIHKEQADCGMTIYMSKLNRFYSDCLQELALLYSTLQTNNEQKQEFLSAISNKILNNKAIKQYPTLSGQTILGFMDYNAMVNANLSDEQIQNIIKHKRNTKCAKIRFATPEAFSIQLPYTNINKSFRLINNIFNIVHNYEHEQLSSQAKEDWTTEGIKNEIIRNRDSYPNLTNYLITNKNGSFNKDRIKNLLDLYQGDEINKTLFTLHSYLRFIERIVLSNTYEETGIDDKASSGQLNRRYIAKVKELKNALKMCTQNEIYIETYNVGDIKAPKFLLPMQDDTGHNLAITLNREQKIHTIFVND